MLPTPRLPFSADSAVQVIISVKLVAELWWRIRGQSVDFGWMLKMSATTLSPMVVDGR
jgi:hypothetical protein